MITTGLLLLSLGQLPPGITPPGGADVKPDAEVKEFLETVDPAEEITPEEKPEVAPVRRISIWQQRAINKAASQASRRRMSHSGPMAGTFEGVGYGTSPNCGTCVPRGGGWTLVADASRQSSNGMWYRCRGWVRNGDSSVPSWTNSGNRRNTANRRRFFRFRR